MVFKEGKIKIYLTQAGILMEGRYTQVPRRREDERNGDFATTIIIACSKPLVITTHPDVTLVTDTTLLLHL